MPLDLLEVSTQVRQMGELLADRRADQHRRLSLLEAMLAAYRDRWQELAELAEQVRERVAVPTGPLDEHIPAPPPLARSEEHTSELQSRPHLVCRLLLEKK